MAIQFWMEAQSLSAAKSMGALPEAGPVSVCPLQVGDMVSFPGFPQMGYRVVSRIFRQDADPKKSDWHLMLAPVGDPISASEALLASQAPKEPRP